MVVFLNLNNKMVIKKEIEVENVLNLDRFKKNQFNF